MPEKESSVGHKFNFKFSRIYRQFSSSADIKDNVSLKGKALIAHVSYFEHYNSGQKV